jgi:hypothetical protein
LLNGFDLLLMCKQIGLGSDIKYIKHDQNRRDLRKYLFALDKK